MWCTLVRVHICFKKKTIISTAFLKKLQIFKFLHCSRAVVRVFVEQLKLKTLNQRDHLMCPPMSSIMSLSICVGMSIVFHWFGLSNKWVNKWDIEWVNESAERRSRCNEGMHEGREEKYAKQNVEQKRWTINIFVRHFKSDCQTKMRSANLLLLLLLLRQLLQV